MATLYERALAAIRAFRTQEPTPAKSLTYPTLFQNPRVATTQAWVRNTNLVVQTKSMRVFDDMRKDDMVKAAMALKKQFIIAGGYDVESPEGEDEEWEVTEFVEKVLCDMEDSFNNKLLQILTALEYGFSVTEKIYEEKDGKLVIKCLNTVAPHDIQFEMTPYGDMLAIKQYSNATSQTETLPLEKFIIYTWDKDFGNAYGNSDLTAAHRPYIMKSQAYNWLAILLERHGVPPIFLHYDQEAIPNDVQAKLEQAVREWQSGGFGMFPRSESKDAIEFYTPELAGQVSTVFIPSFRMFNEDIARALLMPGLLGVTPDQQQGSHARAQVHFDVFMLVVEHARTQLVDLIQEQIIKPLVDLNFPNVEAYPQFKWRPLSDDVRVDLITTWGTLTGQRVVQTTPQDEEHIRKQLKFPEMEQAHASITPNADGSPSPYGPGALPDPNAPADQNGPDNEDPKSDPEDPTPPKPPKKMSEDQRALTTYEMKVNFSKIERDMNDLQDAYNTRLRNCFEDIKQAVSADIRTTWKPTLEYATSITKLPKTDAYLEEVQAFLKDGFKRGRESLISELPGAKFVEASLPDADLEDALAYLRAKSFWISGVTDQKVLSDVRQALLQAVSNGETLDEVMDRIREVFKPYVESSRGDNGELLEPSRIETIVRTNLTDVYNQGRMVQGAMADDALEGWQYSAILDSRTTEICKHMDGKVFRADDKRAMALRPPRHFNCRSVMVPIVVGETINDGDVITDADVTTAKDLSGTGF